MLVSHRYKFIFIKTYKTAGTSTESFFQRYCSSLSDEAKYKYQHSSDETITPHGIIGHRLEGNKGTRKWFNHKSVQSIKRELGPGIFNSYTKICNIRNPYDVAVSAYFYNHRKEGNVKLTPEKLESWLKTHRAIRYLNMNKSMWLNPEFEYEYVRHENIKEDIKRICEKLGIRVDSVVLPEFKVSPGRTHYRTYYNEVSKEIITKLFTRELNLFNYEF
jgi:hypothetical protein